MKKIIQAKDLPQDEKMYFRKDWAGYKQVYPVLDPETKKLNWLNLLVGGKRNGVFLLLILILAAVLYLGVNDLISSYKQVADDPCSFCTTCQAHTSEIIEGIRNAQYKFTNFTIPIYEGEQS